MSDVPRDSHEFTTKDEVRARYNKERDMSKIKVIPARREVSPFNSSTRKRVVVYCRVSTDGISQTSSFELQKHYYLKFVRKRPDWKLVALYSDEGISATSTKNREGLLRMLDDARAGRFDIIVVKNLSRFSRNLMDCMEIIYELRSLPHPVGILFETENMYTLDKNVDFTLQVLSLVAQEESHKKSEAMNSSYSMRFSSGQFVVPDILGYDKTGVNEIAINETEAETVKLIYQMYLAQYDPEEIARTLNSLGRKKHTHIRKDGKVIGGEVNWNRDSVLNVLKNEKRCGDVRAQKTYTPNYLDHKAKQNNMNLPQYYAKDQHPAIVSRDDFLLANKLVEANKGGWREGIPHLDIYTSSSLKGFVSSVPRWNGFSTEDYVSASLRAHGATEEEIDAAYNTATEDENSEDSSSFAPTAGFQHMMTIDSDNYDLFPDEEDIVLDEDVEKEKDGISALVEKMSTELKSKTSHDRYGAYDLSSCELVRSELFSSRDKIFMTADKYGLFFNKACMGRLGMQEGNKELVEIAYNSVEQILLVRRSPSPNEKSLCWGKYIDENKYITKRCACRALTKAIYKTMGWNSDYKYKVMGFPVEIEGELMLGFSLEESVMIVPAKPGSVHDIDTTENREDDANTARSRAIYYDELTEKTKGEISISDLGENKYDPECIRRLLQRGITPKEGWCYLRGIAEFHKNGFTIIPQTWIGTFGDNPYADTNRMRFVDRVRHPGDGPIEKVPYGWTVGLNLPSEEEVQSSIQRLRAEAQI